MADQPEAMRLADALETRAITFRDKAEAAAELRRLVAENALLHERHHFDNGVLKELLDAMISFTNSAYIKKHHPKRYAAAIAAIARAEESK
jgi:hypothetical protein